MISDGKLRPMFNAVVFSDIEFAPVANLINNFRS